MLEEDPFQIVVPVAWNKAARRERCAYCTKRKAVTGHHVVYKQELRRRFWPLYDLRDMLPLCQECHDRHHGPNWKLPLTCIPDVAIDFAFGLLGPQAFDYLRRRYGGDDPRLKQRLELAEAA